MNRLPGWMVAVGLAGMAALSLDCGAIDYSVAILQAHEAIAEAEVAGAGPAPEGEGECQEGVDCWLAPYEYTYAQEHLRKAREEVGQADYQAAVDMAHLARDFARKARDMAAQLRREAGR